MNQQKPLSVESQLLKIFIRPKSKDFCSKEIKTGEEFFSSEGQQQNIYYSLQGIVKLSRIDCMGRETFVALLPEKSFVGLSLLLSKSDLSYRAVAITSAIIISTTVSQFRQKLQESPQLWTPIFHKLLSRSLTVQMTVESRLLKTYESRFVAFLLVLCRDFGVKTNTGVRIDFKLTHQTLADWTHLSRPSVSKILGQLRQQKMISIEQQQITIHDPIALRQYFTIPDYLSTL